MIGRMTAKSRRPDLADFAELEAPCRTLVSLGVSIGSMVGRGGNKIEEA